VPKVSRSRTIAAPVDGLWRIVSDPWHLPRWWPAVERVEEASPEAWTKVLKTPRGKTVRADFTRVDSEPPRRLRWRQEVESSPFERILSRAETEVALEPAGAATVVSLTTAQRLRGLALLGTPMVRRATRRLLDEALDSLDEIAGGLDASGPGGSPEGEGESGSGAA
jgi:uncharacterized protein YndB with AHSA1/START domain